jgi:hypothetical protein
MSPDDELHTDIVTQDLTGWPRALLAVGFGFVTTMQQPAGIEAYAKQYQALVEPRDSSEPVGVHRVLCGPPGERGGRGSGNRSRSRSRAGRAEGIGCRSSSRR